MKTFIVSLGIIILGLTSITYQTDLLSYTMMQDHLWELTEECAAYAALACDETEEGSLIFRENECEECVKYLMNYAKGRMSCFSNGSFSNPVISYRNTEDSYSISVSLKFIPNYNVFRLRGIAQPEFSHTSCYEWIKYEENE